MQGAVKDLDQSIQLNNRYALSYVSSAIAKISRDDKVKIKSYSIRSNFDNQPMNVNWDVTDKSSLSAKQSNLLAGLNDCDIAVAIDKNFGFAFFIRGQIKQLLGHEDYCYDSLMAKKLGLTVEEELLKNCTK